jgi:hypothetical protein
MQERIEILRNHIVIDWVTKETMINAASDLISDAIINCKWSHKGGTSHGYCCNASKKPIKNAFIIMVFHGCPVAKELIVKSCVLENKDAHTNTVDLRKQLRELTKEYWELWELKLVWEYIDTEFFEVKAT